MKKKKETAVEVEAKAIETSEDISLSVEEKRSATIAEANAAEKAIDDKKTKRKKSVFLELIRFVVTGVLCTIVDFACQLGILKVFEITNISSKSALAFYLCFAAAIIVGFAISTLVNFLLSRVWVFQNVDKKINTKSAKSFWTYVGLGFLGLCIGIGVQEGGVFLVNTVWSVNISYDIASISWVDLFDSGGLAFWCFTAIFCVKTLITMIYNYLTRKFIIFKAPKKEQEVQEIVSDPEPEPEVEEVEKEEPKLVTAASFKKIFKEELEAKLGTGNHKMDKEKAWKMVNEEINEREESGTAVK